MGHLTELFTFLAATASLLDALLELVSKLKEARGERARDDENEEGTSADAR